MGRGAAEAGPAGRPGHDLKTPLTIISGNAELLDEDNLPPAQQACVQAILRGARSAEDYVTHLQAITTGFSPATSAQTVSCADLAQACAALGRDLTAPKGITFSCRPTPSPAGPGTLPGPDRLSAGSGKPAQQRRPLYPRRAGLGLRPAPDRPAAVSLGSGQRARLLPEALAKAGKLFYTEEPNRPQGGHLGMGLYSAAQTARAHGGGLCLENTSGGGRATCGFLFHNISAIFPKAVAFLEKPFVLWSGRSPTQIPMRRRLTMP